MAFFAGRRWQDEATEVSVHQLQAICSLVLGLLWERTASLLADEAHIAELLDVLDHWEPVNRIFPCHVVDYLEIVMSQACVPNPRLVVAVGEQAHRLCWI